MEGVSTLSVGLRETPMSIRDDPGLPQRSNQHKKPLVKKGQILGKENYNYGSGKSADLSTQKNYIISPPIPPKFDFWHAYGTL